MNHGDERNRQVVTDVGPAVEWSTTDGGRFMMPMSAHTYTQADRYCRNCGWVTCKWIIDFIVCPKCHGDW
jgi:hypothetical protein